MGQVLVDCLRLIMKVDALAHESDARIPIKGNPACVSLSAAQQDMKQGRLPAAVGSDQGQPVPGADRKRYILEKRPVISHGEILGSNQQAVLIFFRFGRKEGEGHAAVRIDLALDPAHLIFEPVNCFFTRVIGLHLAVGQHGLGDSLLALDLTGQPVHGKAEQGLTLPLLFHGL